jgi:hypothetical protein
MFVHNIKSLKSEHCADLSPYSNSIIKPINQFEDVDYIDEVRFSKKNNLCFRCRICVSKKTYWRVGVQTNSDHLFSSMHVKNYAKLVKYKDERDKYRLEMFKKFYVESYLSLKHEFFKQR